MAQRKFVRLGFLLHHDLSGLKLLINIRDRTERDGQEPEIADTERKKTRLAKVDRNKCLVMKRFVDGEIDFYDFVVYLVFIASAAVANVQMST